MIKRHSISTLCMIQVMDNAELRLSDTIVFRERKLENNQALSFQFKGVTSNYPKVAEVFICTDNLNRIIEKEFNLFERKIYKSYFSDNFTEALLSVLNNIAKDHSDTLYIKLVTLLHGSTVSEGDNRRELTANEYKDIFKWYIKYIDDYIYHETLENPNHYNYNTPYIINGKIQLKLVKRFYKIIKDQLIGLVVNQ